MKAMVLKGYGGPEMLGEADIPNPCPGTGQIMVRVRSAAVNPIDWKIRKGMLRPIYRLRLPVVLGFDFAGEVVDTGTGCKRLHPGDGVFGMADIRVGGSFAQYLVIAEEQAEKKPENLSFDQASAIPLTAQTALRALRDKGGIRPGMKVLVVGASGGVGTFAVQIARNLGAEVTGVCGGGNSALVRELGAKAVVDHTTTDVTRWPERFDVVFDAVSRLSPGRCRRIISPGGVYVSTLPSPGVLVRLLLPFIPPRAKMVSVKNNRADLAILSAWAASGALKPVIDSVVPMEKIAEAMAKSEAGHARGKIVISIPQD